MIAILPDLLRAAVTDVMLVLLLCTMARPKYKAKWIYSLAIVLLMVFNLVGNLYFYLRQNYSAVFLMDIVMLLLIAVVLKPLFLDKLMQWCFSYVTLLNIYGAMMFLSYILCDYFPNPYFAITGLRFLLFGIVVMLFHWKLSLLYRKVADNWHIYFLPTVILLANFIAYFANGDILENMSANVLPLLLLVALGIAVYTTIFHSLNSIVKQYAVCEENLKLQSDRELLHLSAASMTERLRLMDEAVYQQRIAAHDQRHFNSTVLELLQQGEIQAAAALLQKQTETIPPNDQHYCENTAVNAAVAYFVALAQSKGILTSISLDIPNELPFDSLELSMAISSLLEYAIHGCEVLPKTAEKYLRFVCCHVGRFALELSNPCDLHTALDKNDYPSSSKQGHGLGTKSVLAFAAKYDAELFYHIENGIFTVRLLV